MSKNYYIIPIFVPHLGCPHNCVFCNQNKIAGEEDSIDDKYVRRTVEEYLKTIIKEDATVEISFFGGTFTAIPINKQKEFLKVAKEYKDSGKIDFIRLSTRPDYINHDILTHLKGYGVDVIELGVQSLDDKVLRKSGRGHTEEDVKKASSLIKEFGFTLGHQIMLGLPGDTFEKDIETARKSILMRPDISRIYPALVIKETPMELMYLRGEYIPYSLDEAVEITKQIYSMYIENNIKVIRIGLQPTDNINVGGDIVIGPFHPAFRELVEGSIINNKIYQCLKNVIGRAEIQINERNISKLYTNKKQFFNQLKKQLKNLDIVVRTSHNVSKEEVKILVDDKVYNLSI
ncbi:radical SAM protein [Clostridium polyendosporum]|uniref:Radical SAM protein n=1 Tax=Clostridium polyendosporum TaxID=69208 RepID=A0A919RWZ7_9CLOT|nr:radical SAM protein [Clostridium polyendosporum]GIM27834.1 radical SAM protein [Clostridium polyendosporum]